MSGNEHPQWSDRVNKLLMANPTIRAKVGCTESQPAIEYCSTTRTKNHTSRENELERGIDSGRLIYMETPFIGGQLVESKNLRSGKSNK